MYNIYIYIYTHTCIYIYIYIYTYVYTHIYVHMLRWGPPMGPITSPAWKTASFVLLEALSTNNDKNNNNNNNNNNNSNSNNNNNIIIINRKNSNNNNNHTNSNSNSWKTASFVLLEALSTKHVLELWYSHPYPCPRKLYKLPVVLFRYTKLFYKLSWAWTWVWMLQPSVGIRTRAAQTATDRQRGRQTDRKTETCVALGSAAQHGSEARVQKTFAMSDAPFKDLYEEFTRLAETRLAQNTPNDFTICYFTFIIECSIYLSYCNEI